MASSLGPIEAKGLKAAGSMTLSTCTQLGHALAAYGNSSVRCGRADSLQFDPDEKTDAFEPSMGYYKRAFTFGPDAFMLLPEVALN